MPGTGWGLPNSTLVGGDINGEKRDLQTGWGGLVVHQVLCTHLEGCMALLGNGVMSWVKHGAGHWESCMVLQTLPKYGFLREKEVHSMQSGFKFGFQRKQTLSKHSFSVCLCLLSLCQLFPYPLSNHLPI